MTTLTQTRRRWFRFSLRTFLVVVAVFSAWFAREVSIVRARNAVLDWIDQDNEGALTPSPTPSSLRAPFGLFWLMSDKVHEPSRWRILLGEKVRS